MAESDGEERPPNTEGTRRTRLVRIGVVLIALLLAGGLAMGLGILPGGEYGGADGTAAQTGVPTLSPAQPADGTTAPSGATQTQTGGTDGTTPTTAAGVTVRGDTRQFRFEVLSVEQCGRTCRDIDVRLMNAGAAVTDVSATSRLYAGTRDPDNKVEEVTTDIGAMPADSSVQRTVRMDPGISGGLELCNADTVTLVTTVRSAEHGQEFTSHPDIEC